MHIPVHRRVQSRSRSRSRSLAGGAVAPDLNSYPHRTMKLLTLIE